MDDASLTKLVSSLEEKTAKRGGKRGGLGVGSEAMSYRFAGVKRTLEEDGSMSVKRDKMKRTMGHANFCFVRFVREGEAPETEGAGPSTIADDQRKN